MNNSKLTRTLRILDAKELKRLLQFLKSPFYNSNPSIVKLYMFLRAHHPEFSSPKLTREKVFKKIFPGRQYERQKMLNLMSDFTALLEKYMVVLQLEKEELEQKKLLVRSYSERPNCYDVFVKKNMEIEKYLDGLPYRDETYFREKQELNLRYFGHPGTDMVRDGKEALMGAVGNFLIYKDITEIKNRCALNAWANTVGMKKNTQDLELYSSKKYFAYTFYSQLENLQIGIERENELNELVESFMFNVEMFRHDDRSNILKILLNKSNRLFNQGRTEFAPISLDLYKIGLDFNCLLVNKKLKESTFHNIVSFGTYGKEFDWTKKFMDEYQKLLDSKVREKALALGMSLWYFERNEFNQVLIALQHDFKEPLDILKSKLLLTKTWYELFCKDYDYIELLFSHLDAFEKYARRSTTVSERMIGGVLKYINYVRKLIKVKEDVKGRLSLRKEIAKNENVVLKTWLLQKAK